MLVLICMLPAGMCTQQDEGLSLLCSCHPPTPANPPGNRTTHIKQFTHKRLDDRNDEHNHNDNSKTVKNKSLRTHRQLDDAFVCKNQQEEEDNAMSRCLPISAGSVSEPFTDSHRARSRGCARPSVPSPTAAPGRGSRPWR